MTRKSVFLILLISLFTIILHAQETDCPFNLVNDPYPGQCPRYIDNNDNSICDLSEIDEDSIYEEDGDIDTVIENREAEITDTSNINEDDMTGDAAEMKNSNDSVRTDEILDDPVIAANDRYALKIIIPLWLIMFVITIIAKHSARIALSRINQMWNWLMLISFIPVSITSIMLVLRELGLMNNAIIIDCVFIHNLTGIVFILSSMSHVYIKWTYYRNCLKKRKCEDK